MELCLFDGQFGLQSIKCPHCFCRVGWPLGHVSSPFPLLTKSAYSAQVLCLIVALKDVLGCYEYKCAFFLLIDFTLVSQLNQPLLVEYLSKQLHFLAFIKVF